eukprot:3309689-Rhodomonas_salina.1
MGCEDVVLLAELSGSEHAGDTLTTQTGFMKVEFESDANMHMGGFDAAWTSVSTCGVRQENSGGRCLKCANSRPEHAVYPGEGCEWRCAAGFYLSEGGCAACPATLSSAAGSESAADCNVCALGFTGPDGGPCVACVAGTYKEEA